MVHQAWGGPDKAKIVRRIFQLNLRGGIEWICKVLRDEGVAPIGRSTKGIWYDSYVEKILCSRAVLGEFQPHTDRSGEPRTKHGEPVLGYYPRIVSDEIWHRAAEARAARRYKNTGGGRPGPRAGAVMNLVPGICHCVNCDAKVSYYNKGERDTALFGCNGARSGAGCRWIGFPAPAFDAHLLYCVLGLDPSALDHGSHDDALRAEESEATVAKARIAKRIDALTDAIADESDKDIVSAIKAKIAAEAGKAKELDRRLETLRDATASAIERARSAVQIAKLATRMGTPKGREELRTLLLLVVERVDVCFAKDPMAEKVADRQRDKRYLSVRVRRPDGSGWDRSTKGVPEGRLVAAYEELVAGRSPWPTGYVVDVAMAAGATAMAALAPATGRPAKKPVTLDRLTDAERGAAVDAARRMALHAFVHGVEEPFDATAWKAVTSMSPRIVRISEADYRTQEG